VTAAEGHVPLRETAPGAGPRLSRLRSTRLLRTRLWRDRPDRDQSQPLILRLVRLHLASRRVPTALAVFAACAVVLRIALHWQWIQGTGPLAQQLPLVIETGTAATLAVTARDPFGEPERATGRRLPYLRLAAAVALTAAAVGALAAGSAAADLPGGVLEVLRNVVGLAGISLLSATALGPLAWIGPVTYLVVAEYALAAAWQSPWTWPARPSHDLGAALCSALVFIAGTVAITVRGSRE
jgi:hypothetical protein